MRIIDSPLGPVRMLRAVAAGPGAAVSATNRTAEALIAMMRAAEQVPGLLLRVQKIVTAAELIVVQVTTVTAEAEAVVAQVERTRAAAAIVVADVSVVAERDTELVARLQPVLAAVSDIDPDLVRTLTAVLDRLQPLLGAASALNADVPVEAAQLLHRSLPLLEQMDKLVLPLLAEMRAAVPDVREILPVVRRLEPVMVDVETRIAGLPGPARLRRRGERESKRRPPTRSLIGRV